MTFPALLIDILSWAMILAGSFFVIIGAVGILRFPDFWSRLHAASVTESAGMILLLIGMALQTGWTLIAFKLGVIGIFMLITAQPQPMLWPMPRWYLGCGHLNYPKLRRKRLPQKRLIKTKQVTHRKLH